MTKEHPEADHTTPRPVWVWHLTTLVVWGFVLALFLRFFNAISMILLGVLAAASLAAAMRPMMRLLPGRRWVRGVLAGATPFVVALILLTGIGWVVAKPIEQELNRWPQARESLDHKLAEWSAMLGLEQTISVDGLLGQLGSIVVNRQLFATTANVMTALILAMAFIFFGAIFFLVEREQTLTEPILVMLPQRRRDQLCGFIDELAPKLRWWVIGTLTSMIVVGVLSGIGYRIAGLQMAIPLAALAGAGEIVPTVGPTFAFLVALLFAITQGTSTIVAVVIVWAVIQTIESYVLIPYVMKKAVELPPVVTLFTVVFWGHVFGAAGLLMAIPLNLLAWTALKHFTGHGKPPAPEGEPPPPDPDESAPGAGTSTDTDEDKPPPADRAGKDADREGT